MGKAQITGSGGGADFWNYPSSVQALYDTSAQTCSSGIRPMIRNVTSNQWCDLHWSHQKNQGSHHEWEGFENSLFTFLPEEEVRWSHFCLYSSMLVAQMSKAAICNPKQLLTLILNKWYQYILATCTKTIYLWGKSCSQLANGYKGTTDPKTRESSLSILFYPHSVQILLKI